MFQKIQYFDDNVINWVGRLHKPKLNKFMVFMSAIGSKGFVWFCLCVPLLIVLRWRNIGVNVILGLAVAHIAGEILIKHIVCRIRPCHKLEDEYLIVKRPRYYSFPSGHTTSSFAVFAVILLRLGGPLALAVAVVAITIGFSRVYLRVHYLTDVLFGILLGTLCGALSVELMQQLAL